MAALVGGVGALILGLILLIIWWNYFIVVLAGIIPILLLLGGALAAYLGYEEIKDRREIEKEEAKSDTKATGKRGNSNRRRNKKSDPSSDNGGDKKKKPSSLFSGILDRAGGEVDAEGSRGGEVSHDTLAEESDPGDRNGDT